MTKQEVIELVNSLSHEDDKYGNIEALVYDVNGGMFTTDSIRLDMDSGRLIVCQKNSDCYETNKKNWKQELEFAKK